MLGSTVRPLALAAALGAPAVPVLAAQSATAIPLASPAASPSPGDGEVRRPAPTPLAVPSGAALLVNSGSTNFNGYQIAVLPDGSATMNVGGATSAGFVARPQVRWLFLKLEQAAPLASLHTEHCMKSASFGSSTYVVYSGSQSPDLSCGGDAAVRELARTIDVIVKQLGVTSLPKHARSAM